MAIIRFDPFRNSFFQPFFEDNDEWPEITMTQGLNVYEKEGQIVVKAVVPGIAQKDLDITYEDGVLHIRGSVEENEEEKKAKKVIYRKQMISSVDYTTYLPRPIDPNNIEAEVKDGILTISAAVTEAAKPKKITVKSS